VAAGLVLGVALAGGVVAGAVRPAAAAAPVKSYTLSTSGTIPVPTSSACLPTAELSTFVVSARGYPVPTFYLSGEPPWASLQNFDGAGVALLHINGAPQFGTYHFQVWSMNSAGFGVQTVYVALGAHGGTLQFLSDSPYAVAHSGTPLAVRLPLSGCREERLYRLTSADPPGSWQPGVDQITGTIVGTPPPSYTGRHTYTLTASDGFTIVSRQVTIVVDPAPLTVTTGDLPAATVGSPYRAALAGFGGYGERMWFAEWGSPLPAGLSLEPDGTITGTPTVVGVTSFNVYLLDYNTPAPSSSVIKKFSITVNPRPSLAVSTSSVPIGVVGEPYTMSLHATDGTGQYSWSLAPGSALPAGLTLQKDGTIAGKPTAIGETQFTVQVTDSANATATATLTASVAGALRGLFARLYPGGNGDGLTAGVAGASTAAGAGVVVSPSAGQSADVWTFRPVGAAFEIVNQGSGQCLTTDGVAGHTVYQAPCKTAEGQLWQTPPEFGGESTTTSWIRNPAADLYLDVDGGHAAAGAAVVVAPWNATAGQSFFPAYGG
jgi:hypothetical protein